jgi:hypothetical protein
MTETFRPLGDKAIMELAYREWFAFTQRSAETYEKPSTQLSSVFVSDVTGLRYAVISSFIGILALFQVEEGDGLKRLNSWPRQDPSLDSPRFFLASA